MANIIQQSDFVGKYQLSQNDTIEDKLEDFIDQFYPDYVREILGATLGNLFIADLDVSGVPTNPIYLEFYNPFEIDDGTIIRKSIGMKKIILGFLYYEIARDSNFFNSMSGNRATDGENSSFVNMGDPFSTIFNLSVASAWAVQWYVDVHNPNGNDYSSFNGQNIDCLISL